MVERFNRTILNSLSLLVSRIGTRNYPFSWFRSGVPFTKPWAIQHPRCSLDVIFVFQQILCSVGHQMLPWRLRSTSKNSTHRLRRCLIWLGEYYTTHQEMASEVPVDMWEGGDGLQFVGQAYPTHALLDSSPVSMLANPYG
ncbi:hypothetical protein TNCV_2370831 [Trichonephila clavipes]|nr:hypothetical protein TNCV_2370831 [Trichonephila clavipes]